LRRPTHVHVDRAIPDAIELPFGLEAFDGFARDGRQQHVAEAVLHDPRPLLIERDGALAVRRGLLRGEAGMARGEQGPEAPSPSGHCCAYSKTSRWRATASFHFVARTLPRRAKRFRHFALLKPVLAITPSNWIDRVTMGAPQPPTT
jgi:hypothetical protein